MSRGGLGGVTYVANEGHGPDHSGEGVYVCVGGGGVAYMVVR